MNQDSYSRNRKLPYDLTERVNDALSDDRVGPALEALKELDCVVSVVPIMQIRHSKPNVGFDLKHSQNRVAIYARKGFGYLVEIVTKNPVKSYLAEAIRKLNQRKDLEKLFPATS